MEINLNVINRPLSTHEAEFETLVDLLDAGKWGNPAEPNPYTKQKRSGLFGLGRKKHVLDRNAAVDRLNGISQHPGVTLDAPVVGRDMAANAWVAEALANGILAAENVEQALEIYDGLFVFDLLPICDGFPVYSPSNWDKGYDRYTLHATVIEAYEPKIGNALTTYLYGLLLAAELAEWADKLRCWADDFAGQNQLEHILGDRNFHSEDLEKPDTCLHIIDQSARWATFWSERGHGCEPMFDADST